MHEEDPLSGDGWQRLAEQAHEKFAEEVADLGCPVWIQFFRDPSSEAGLSVGTVTGPDGLLGWTAPPDCVAVGMVATGKLVLVDGQDGSRQGRSRISMSCVVGREGQSGWFLRLSDGTTSRIAPEEGRVLDCLKRCFGLPSIGVLAEVSELHGAAWALSVLEFALASPDPLPWSQVTRLHPLARVLDGYLDAGQVDRGAGGPPAPSALDSLIRMAANGWSWEEIRLDAARGGLASLVEPELAEWMDEGMFSRWLLGQVPSVDQILRDLDGFLTPTAAKRLAASLRRAPAFDSRP